MRYILHQGSSSSTHMHLYRRMRLDTCPVYSSRFGCVFQRYATQGSSLEYKWLGVTKGLVTVNTGITGAHVLRMYVMRELNDGVLRVPFDVSV